MKAKVEQTVDETTITFNDENVLENVKGTKPIKGLKMYKKEGGEIKLICNFTRIPKTGIGDLSDGYHTFNELYHQRAIMCAVICNQFKSLSWKSKLHHTGDMYDGMFIVGIETPEGQATYHFDTEPYWDLFDIKTLPKAPEWDGHTPEEAIKRISSLITTKRKLF